MSDLVKPVWAGFWARLGAFVVDTILLGLVGFGAGMVLFDQLARLGAAGRLVGLAVSLLYFGVLSSKIGGGATLGQRLLGLKVAGLNGRPIGLVRSLLRAAVLVVPMTLNGAQFQTPDERLMIPLFAIDIVLVFGVLAAQIYLMLFNRPSRQLVHDLVLGTVVVKRAARDIPSPRSGRHAAVALVLTLAIPALLGAGLYFLSSGFIGAGFIERLKPLAAPRNAVSALPEVIDVGVNDSTTTVYDGDGKPPTVTRTLVVTAQLNAWPADVDKEIQRVGEAAWKSYKLTPDQKMRVVLTYGYDIGIASNWRNQFDEYHWPGVASGPAEAPTAAPTSGVKT